MDVGTGSTPEHKEQIQCSLPWLSMPVLCPIWRRLPGPHTYHPTLPAVIMACSGLLAPSSSPHFPQVAAAALIVCPMESPVSQERMAGKWCNQNSDPTLLTPNRALFVLLQVRALSAGGICTCPAPSFCTLCLAQPHWGSGPR